MLIRIRPVERSSRIVREAFPPTAEAANPTPFRSSSWSKAS